MPCPSLFRYKSDRPEGLLYADDFVSEDDEGALIVAIAALPLEPFQFGMYRGKRRLACFGFKYDYSLRRLTEADPISGWPASIIDRVESFGGTGTHISQVLCTEYEMGTGIGWHRDKPQFEHIFGVSLASQCKLRFRRSSGAKWRRFTIGARRRSIYVMAGPSRTDWEHSIPAVENLAGGRWQSVSAAPK